MLVRLEVATGSHVHKFVYLWGGFGVDPLWIKRVDCIAKPVLALMPLCCVFSPPRIIAAEEHGKMSGFGCKLNCTFLGVGRSEDEGMPLAASLCSSQQGQFYPELPGEEVECKCTKQFWFLYNLTVFMILIAGLFPPPLAPPPALLIPTLDG